MSITRMIKFLGSVFGRYILKDVPSIAPTADDNFAKQLTSASICLWLAKIQIENNTLEITR